jgi:hypothetical protein
MTEPHIPASDIDVLRRLAERKRQIADHAVNRERRQAWLAHDAGSNSRPMILAEYCGVQETHSPFAPQLACQSDWARNWERSILAEFYQYDVLRDDHVIEPWMALNWRIPYTNYGVEATVQLGDNDGHPGSRRWDHPIQDLDADFAKLQPRVFSVDRIGTLEEKARMEKIFDGILPVCLRGGFYWTLGMTATAIQLIGLENLMLYMYDHPAGLHRLMAFLRDDHLAFTQWLEREGLYSLNNANDYIGSGSMGYTRDLPQPDAVAGAPVRRKDLWCLSESQETVGVGPDLFDEFIFPYQLSLAEKFGKCYYGCCEPVNNRWHVLKRMPNLARVSVSPWADEDVMAAACGRQVVYSRKPNPTLISTGTFDENAIRADLRKTLTAARGCRIELIMKDVHTLNNQPERLPRWVQIAREVVEEMA